jgi:hypothetical protein
MPVEPIRVLWLYGAPSAGKTTTGWEIYRSLPVPARGYVDIDQLGMCYPAGADDPQRDRLKARALGGVLANVHAYGARLVIVSGILDPALLGLYQSEAPAATFTLCRMTATATELRRRHAARGPHPVPAAEVVDLAERLDDAGHEHVTIDTTLQRPTQAAERLVQLTGLSTPAGAPADRTAPSLTFSNASGQVLFVIGPPAVGKSTIGWSLFTRSQTRQTTGFVDLAQIGFLQPAPEADPDHHRLKAANLAALWSTFHAWGAQRLIVNGAVPDPNVLRLYQQALPAADVVAVRLRAGPLELARRLTRQAHGCGVKLPGDRPTPWTAEQRRRRLQTLLAQAEALDRRQPGDAVVDTDNLTVEQAALRAAEVVNWL